MDEPKLDYEAGKPTRIAKTSQRLERDEVPNVWQALPEAQGERRHMQLLRLYPLARRGSKVQAVRAAQAVSLMWTLCTVLMQASITYRIPLVSRMRFASSFSSPSWAQKTSGRPSRAFISTATSATFGSSSFGLKTSTTSTILPTFSGSSRRLGYAVSPRISVAVGLTGTIR